MSSGKNMQSPRNRLWQATGDYEQAARNMATESASQAALRGQAQQYLNWENAPGRSIADLPAIGSALKIGAEAAQRAAREQMGTGGLRLGQPGSAQQANNLRNLYAEERARNFGAGLEQAVASRRAEALGTLLPSAQLEYNRNAASLQSALNREQFWGQQVANKKAQGGGGWSKAIGTGLQVATLFGI